MFNFQHKNHKILSLLTQKSHKLENSTTIDNMFFFNF